MTVRPAVLISGIRRGMRWAAASAGQVQMIVFAAHCVPATVLEKTP